MDRRVARSVRCAPAFALLLLVGCAAAPPPPPAAATCAVPDTTRHYEPPPEQAHSWPHQGRVRPTQETIVLGEGGGVVTNNREPGVVAPPMPQPEYPRSGGWGPNNPPVFRWGYGYGGYGYGVRYWPSYGYAPGYGGPTRPTPYRPAGSAPSVGGDWAPVPNYGPRMP